MTLVDAADMCCMPFGILESSWGLALVLYVCYEAALGGFWCKIAVVRAI